MTKLPQGYEMINRFKPDDLSTEVGYQVTYRGQQISLQDTRDDAERVIANHIDGRGRR